MNIIIEKQKDTRIIDGINEILALDDKTFQEIIERLVPKDNKLENINFFYTTDKYENSSGKLQLGLERVKDENGNMIGRFYYGGKITSISQIFKELETKLKDLKEDLPEHDRAKQILKTRDLDAFKMTLLDKNGENKEIIDKVFDIVSDDEVCKKFLDYDNNKDYFSIKGQPVEIGQYLIYLGNIFGKKDREGNLKNDNRISTDFYIPELAQYKERWSQIFDGINVDRYVNPTYEFKKFTTLNRLSNTIIRKGEEPEWNISAELNNAILGKMPNDLTLEEKAMYIYCKLCKELSYDEGYLFRDKLGDGRYSDDFSQEHLEGINPGSKITCWDFSRIYSKMINELDGDIESVIIAEGANYGHFLTGFYTNKVSVILEAINGRTGGTNDLMKAKNGIKFEGIEIVSDREGILDKAIKKVYPQIFGREQSSIQDYLQELKCLPREEISDNLEMKLQSFIETMRENNISGNEAIQTLSAFHKAGFFGEELDRAYLGKEEIQDGKKNYRRMALIRSKNEFQEKQNESSLYIMDSDSLELSSCTVQEVMEKLKSGEYVYESEKHKMPGIDMEER